MLRSVLVLFLAALFACDGQIGGTPNPDASRADRPDIDAGADVGIPPGCEEAGPAILVFETKCVRCHRAGGTFPVLTRDGLADLKTTSSPSVGLPLLVENDPAASWLYRKMANLDLASAGADAGSVMPAGANPDWDALPDYVVTIRDWIDSGAPTECDGLPPPDIEYDPNTLDRDALFTCADPGATRSSPARIRRIEREEFTHMVSRRLDGASSSVIDNPLLVPVEHPYPSYTDGVSIDSGTLNLLLLTLPEATPLWTQNGFGEMGTSELRARELSCIFDDAAPDDACTDRYLALLLRRGILYQTPSDWEWTHTRDLLVRALGEESDVAERQSTLDFVVQASLLTAGSLFRSELGEDDGRLSNADLALALGRVLSTHPPSSLKTTHHDILVGDPDADRISEGWLAAVSEAAAIPAGTAGSIQDPEVRRALVHRYGGGVDVGRHDIYLDYYQRYASYPGSVARRGQYWIATEFQRFFRQWLDYDAAVTSFKDTPAATSRYEDRDRIDYVIGYLQGGSNDEADLAQHLDDTIARIVVETDSGGGNVFEELMLGRQWHLPATGMGSETCTTAADCSTMYDACSYLGDCRGTNERTRASAPFLFGIESGIPATQNGRWVEVPASERLGVLTHPAWLGAHGGNFEDDASIIHRGKWLRERLFCQTVPPLSLVEVEAQLVPSAPELSARDRVTSSTSGSTCSACHSQMNSLGLPFELFNHAGFVRETDHGRAPDGSTSIDNLPIAAGEDLNGDYATPFALIQAIASSRQAKRGFIRHAFRYFMGRDERMEDACTLTAMESALDARGSFIDMIAELVASETFTRRSLESGGDE